MTKDIFKDEDSVEIGAVKKLSDGDANVVEVIEDFEMYKKFKIWLDPDKDFVNLTDMWRAIGGKASQRPFEWRRLPGSKRFIEEFLIKIEGSLKAGKSRLKKYIVVKKGRGDRSAGTYTHWQIAIEYARYLDKKFAIWANEKLRQRFEEIKDPDAGKKKADRRHVSMKIINQFMSGEITDEEMKEMLNRIALRDPGADIFNEFKDEITSRTNGPWPRKLIYSKTEKALTGKTVMEQRAEMDLKESENYRNYLSSDDLFARMYVEKLSAILVRTLDENIDYDQLSHSLDKWQDTFVGLFRGDPRYISIILDASDRIDQIKKHAHKHHSSGPRTSFGAGLIE